MIFQEYTMWNFEYKADNKVFCLENQEAGFHLILEMEDGMSCEVIDQNPIAFFCSKRVDATKQVKTVLCLNVQTYVLDISIRMLNGEFMKHEITVAPLFAKSLFHIAKMYQNQIIVPSFSFKPLTNE